MSTRQLGIAAVVTVSSLVPAPPAAAGGPATSSNLPVVHEVGDVTYLSGGIGAPEVEAIKHVAQRYPLELEFLRKAKPQDEFLSQVKVRIKDAHDALVLDVTSDGPFLLAKMPAGKYTISVEHAGKIENRTVQIAPQEHRRLVFEWLP